MVEKSLLDHVDVAVRPQDDLFGYVNGRWLDTVEIPPDLSSSGGFMDLRLEAEEHVGQILREAADSAASGVAELGSSTQKIGDLFASFMDEAEVERLGATPLTEDLAAIAGLTDVRAMVRLLGRFEREGVDGLLGSYVSTDDRRSERYVVNLTQGGLGLPDESYYREESFAETRATYAAHVTSMLRLVGWGEDEAADGATRLLALETRLAAGHWDNVASRDVIKTYNLMRLDELVSAAPAVDWSGWIAALQMMMGRVAAVCRIWRQTSTPENPGRFRSTSARSNGPESWKRATASGPSQRAA